MASRSDCESGSGPIMKSPQHFKKVFIHRDYVDMRKAINGLSQIVESANMGNLMEPHLFVFSGKTRSVIKILYFDRSGFCLWQKRLEQDKFPWPRKSLDTVVKSNPSTCPTFSNSENLIKLDLHKQGGFVWI